MKLLRTIFIALGIVLLTACTSAPIKEVSSERITTTRPVSLDDVTKAIVTAGGTLGWQMDVLSPGKILGTLKLRSHLAKVDITYDTQTYNIKYKDSTNLDYTGTTIHRNYNGWIQNLDNAIKTQLNNITQLKKG